MSRFKAVLFDLDGTLLDTIDDLADSMNAALGSLGFPPRTVAECKRFVGDGIEAFARRSLPPEADEPALEKLLELYREHYARNWAAKTRPYAGIPELLDALAGRRLPMAVLSNKPDDFTRRMVARLLSRWRFARVRGDRPGAARKPDPSAALEIAKDLRVEPADFLYVGDTNTDMRTAVGAGMHPVGALWGFRDADELLAGGAKVLLEKPLDLLKCLS